LGASTGPITLLAKLAPQLPVIARTTAMHCKCSRKEVTRIARAPNVSHVVEGSVRRANALPGA
jgi:TolB-like protein